LGDTALKWSSAGPAKKGTTNCGSVRAMWNRPMSFALLARLGSVSQASAQSTA